MGYNTIYRRCFIKANPEGTLVLPLVLCGSSNWRDADGNISKGWAHVAHKFLMSAEDIEKEIARVPEQYRVGDNFQMYNNTKYNGRFFTYRSYSNFLRKCFSEAGDLESLKPSYFSIDLAHGSSFSPRSTEQLQADIAALLLLSDQSEWRIHMSKDDYFLRKLKTKRVQFSTIAITDPWAISIPNTGYLVRRTSRGYKYSYAVSDETKLFPTSKSATAYITKYFSGRGGEAVQKFGTYLTTKKSIQKPLTSLPLFHQAA